MKPRKVFRGVHGAFFIDAGVFFEKAVKQAAARAEGNREWGGMKMTLAQDMMAAADGMREELVTGRRDLHRYPEPGWMEFRTAAKVAKF